MLAIISSDTFSIPLSHFSLWGPPVIHFLRLLEDSLQLPDALFMSLCFMVASFYYQVSLIFISVMGYMETVCSIWVLFLSNVRARPVFRAV